MVRRGHISKQLVLGVLAACVAITGSGIRTHDASAASSFVQGSYSAAMTFANQFCADTSSNGVGPSLNGIGDLVWITAPDGSGTITANRGDLYAPVTVHIAGKFCSGYNGKGGGSDYNSDLGSVSGQLMYGQNTANAIFHVTESASLYIGDFASEGTYRINMSLASFFVILPSGASPTPKASPNAWTDLFIDYNDKWAINGQSYVNNTTKSTGRKQGNPAVTASPLDTLDWAHDLRNSGPNDMDRTVYYNVDRTGYGNGWDASHIPTGDAKGVFNALFVNFGGSTANNTQYVVQPSDGGRTLCQRISWLDSSWNTPGAWGSSGFACAIVPFNYDLTPSVSGINGVTTAGASIRAVIPTVNNSLPGNASATTDSPPVEWQLKRIEVPPAGTISMTQAENGTTPCAHYGFVCIDKGSGTRTFSAGNANPALAVLAGETVAPNTPVGTQICYTLSVKPYKQGGSWRHSAPICVRVSKQPKLQVWGHDVHTRRNIDTGTTELNDAGTNKLFGSWVEYGGFSVQANSGFASGAGLNGGNTNTDATDAANIWNKLTFANVNDAFSTSHGHYTLPAELPTITDQFLGAPSGGPIQSNLGNLGSGTYATGDFTLTASDVGQMPTGEGKAIIIVSTGTVTIDGNITYRGPGAGDTFSKISELPQVIIIAKNINIKNAVMRIDAWLLALDKTTPTSGAINTCSDVSLATDLTVDICNNALTVNGPVVARHLHLRRTAGSDTVATAGTPAEVFNLRPDTFLWAQARASQAGKVQTVYSVELPPRF